jgi:hypothetical protein
MELPDQTRENSSESQNCIQNFFISATGNGTEGDSEPVSSGCKFLTPELLQHSFILEHVFIHIPPT